MRWCLCTGWTASRTLYSCLRVPKSRVPPPNPERFAALKVIWNISPPPTTLLCARLRAPPPHGALSDPHSSVDYKSHSRTINKLLNFVHQSIAWRDQITKNHPLFRPLVRTVCTGFASIPCDCKFANFQDLWFARSVPHSKE